MPGGEPRSFDGAIPHWLARDVFAGLAAPAHPSPTAEPGLRVMLGERVESERVADLHAKGMLGFVSLHQLPRDAPKVFLGSPSQTPLLSRVQIHTDVHLLPATTASTPAAWAV